MSLILSSISSGRVDHYDYEGITNSRIQMLPEWVQTMINR